MSSSAPITSAGCCVPATRGSATTGSDTGSARSPTAWVCGRHALVFRLRGRRCWPLLAALHPWGQLPGAALIFAASFLSRRSDDSMPAVSALIKAAVAKEFFRELVPVRVHQAVRDESGRRGALSNGNENHVKQNISGQKRQNTDETPPPRGRLGSEAGRRTGPCGRQIGSESEGAEASHLDCS